MKINFFTKLLSNTIAIIVLAFSLLISCKQNPDSIDSFIKNEMIQRKIPGLSIAIVKNGEVIHKNAYGYSVIEHQVPAKIETIFELASITKQFVATGILLLEQEGLLDIEKPIETYIDSLPKQWKHLTLKRLLSHTAGLLPQEQEWKSLKKDGWPKHVTRDMMWNATIKDSIYDSSGNQFNYHNTGYYLAILIIESIAQQNYIEFFHERIFNPLGMTSTYFEDLIKVIPDQANGYTLRNNEIIKIRRVGQEDISGGQGLYSNIEDMIKWNEAINRNTLLNKEHLQKMFTNIKLNDGQYTKYGLGWWLPKRNEIPYYYHNGVTGPEILKIPSLNLDIIILSNMGQGDYDEVQYWGLALDIAGNFFDNKLKHPQKEVPYQLKDFQFALGKFEYKSGGDLEIFVKNKQLYLKDSYGEALMIYIGNNTFTLESDPVLFKFINANRIQVIEETWNDDFANRIY